jgi:histidinol phosphatase-like PHP family hydrolase
MREQGFYDLHTHTVFSDGGMIPAGLMQRALVRGCLGLAITDHVDSSNLEFAFSNVNRFVEDLGREWRMDIIPGSGTTTAPTNELDAEHLGENWHLPVIAGVELTSVPPRKIAALTEQARSLGARWVVVHGETINEPVAPGTNRAAIEAKVDLLSHPGLISAEDAARAAELGVHLEITTHKGHSLSNGWVAQRARESGAKLLLNTDCHISAEILDAKQRRAIAFGAGLTAEEVDRIWENGRRVIERLTGVGV